MTIIVLLWTVDLLHDFYMILSRIESTTHKVLFNEGNIKEAQVINAVKVYNKI